MLGEIVAIGGLDQKVGAGYSRSSQRAYLGIEPDRNSTQKFLVKNGYKRLPIIIRRIRVSDSDFEKAYLMEVVSLINKDCRCVTDEELAELFEVGSFMKDGFHRNRFHRAFDELKEIEQ